MRVVIVGAGIGGLTLALALHARGVRPLLLEQAPVLEAVGAGVQLGPNAARLLFALGLEAPLRVVASLPPNAEVRDGVSGALRLRLPLGAAAEVRWGGPYLQIHRGDLQAVLLEAVRARAAAELRLGGGVAQASAGGVTLQDGSQIAADLVVGADGVRSCVREAVAPGCVARPGGETAWRALLPSEALAAPPTGAVVWTWPRRHLVAYPVCRGGAINLVAVTPGAISGPSWSEPGDPNALRAAFTDAEPQARALLAAVTQTTRWALADLAPLPRWTAKGVALLGDAAHPMRPYLAQGAAMAIEDAEALARQVTAHQPLSSALAAYETERRPRATRVQTASRRNGTVFHLPAPAAALTFAAAAVIDRARGGPAARMDWLYGYSPPPR